MTGARITLDHNLPKLEQALSALIAAAADTYQLMDDIGGYMVSSTQGNFDAQQSPEGVAWVRSQAAEDRGGLTLVDQNDLYRSFTHIATNDSVQWGTNSVYGAIHHFGGQTGRNKSVTLRARPFLGVSPDDEIEIELTIQDHLIAHAGGLE